MTAALEVRNLTKRFRGVVALDGVSFEVRSHEVVGLIGENGAGKSTLLKVLSGIYQPDEGEIYRNGERVAFRSSQESARAGIGMVHQEQSLITNVTVGENILLGAEGDAVRFGFYNWPRLNANAQRQLDKIASRIPPTAIVESLSFAERQMVELAKALYVEEGAKAEPVIVLDEPTSVLEGAELETLFDQIDRLRKIASVIFVSHRLDEVLRVSDRVYVLKDGRSVGEMRAEEADVETLHRLMVGRESSAQFYREDEQLPVEGKEVVLSVDGLSRRGAFDDVSFEVREGEVLGIAGVLGSGREELSRVLFGAEPFTAGSVRLHGKPVRFGSPVDAVTAGLGYIPAERRIEGIADGMSVEENIFLVDPDTVSWGPFRRVAAARDSAREWIERLRVRTPDERANIGNLSGGNQQKVVLAKWLNSPKLRLLILDHPTRGLDVGAKEDVYAFVREQCARGMAVVLLADSLEETIALSHTILVMRDGRVEDRFDARPGSKPLPVDLVEKMV
ncbi:sugar ABC transporter ATP-binding protein [Leucobacter sp. CSA1]|uniref:Sugar ABC transporter ATP-binding protein n=1 Tax=Leucobacter chromiisoli TaxID=2796471 RepID=A0A934Q866_9MICO|nr:sugar ABC transporter ATP-binding protein [Leucobacter chromiisoli]MBK0418617.1 sugar ABC transporter ATP-binding protein [Leucobacter chromiisoli]